MKIERGYYPEDFPESFLEQLENYAAARAGRLGDTAPYIAPA